MSIKVGINGFGVIGRRVAYAVNKQEDMDLVGVGKTSPDYKAKIGIEKGFNFYDKGMTFRQLWLDNSGSGYNIFDLSNVWIGYAN